MDKRPDLSKGISIKDFRDFYWLKEELVSFCREEGLSRQGGKIVIANRVEEYLRTGLKNTDSDNSTPSPVSKFDWRREPLTLDTVITDNYRNSENVRNFFVGQLGSSFKFNVKFMSWLKSNAGKSLADAVSEYKRIKSESLSAKRQKSMLLPKLCPQFEYNRYIRDFMQDNPGTPRELAVQCWNVKRSIRGNNVYQQSDLGLIGSSQD